MFSGCTAWIVTDLVGNPEHWFPHNEAHISSHRVTTDNQANQWFCHVKTKTMFTLKHLYIDVHERITENLGPELQTK